MRRTSRPKRPYFHFTHTNLTKLAESLGYNTAKDLGSVLKRVGLRYYDGTPTPFAIDGGFGKFMITVKDGEDVDFFTWHCERVMDYLIYLHEVRFRTYQPKTSYNGKKYRKPKYTRAGEIRAEYKPKPVVYEQLELFDLKQIKPVELKPIAQLELFPFMFPESTDQPA